MKILLVCEYWYGTGGWGYKRVLEEMGHEVEVFDFRQPRFSLGASIPLIGRISRGINSRKVSEEFIAAAKTAKADAILFLKAETLRYEAIAEVKREVSAPLIQWYPDSPFNIEAKNATRDSIASIPLFDIYYIYAKSLIRPLEEAGAKRVEYLPFCYDPEMLKPPDSVSEEDRRKYATDVVFAGTWEPQRQWWLEKITEFDLSIWGNMWEQLPAGNPAKDKWRGPAIYGQEISKLFFVSKIHLNFLREQNKDSNNVRSFEIPGFGGFLLTERSDEQAKELYTEGEEIACFGSVEELKEKIAYYLDHEDERIAIAEAGHERAKNEHQIVHRMEQIISDIQAM